MNHNDYCTKSCGARGARVVRATPRHAVPVVAMRCCAMACRAVLPFHAVASCATPCRTMQGMPHLSTPCLRCMFIRPRPLHTLC